MLRRKLSARQAAPLLGDMLGLGRTSPQALGNQRMLITTVGRQGRFDDANKLLAEGYELVEEMGQGRFAKYVDEEREALDEVKKDLDMWEGQAKHG